VNYLVLLEGLGLLKLCSGSGKKSYSEFEKEREEELVRRETG
jgi:hypothetical protein